MPTLLATDLTAPEQAIAVDDTFVYWTTPQAVERVPLDGGASSFVAIQQGAPARLAIVGSALYWTNFFDLESIHRADDPHAATVIDTVVERNQGGARNLRVDANYLYWTNDPLSNPCSVNVARLDALDGGPVVTLAAGRPGFLGLGVAGSSIQGSPAQLALDDSRVYFTDDVAGTVIAVSRDGKTVTTLADHQKKPSGIAVDAEFVYWVNTGDGTVLKVAK